MKMEKGRNKWRCKKTRENDLSESMTITMTKKKLWCKEERSKDTDRGRNRR